MVLDAGQPRMQLCYSLAWQNALRETMPSGFVRFVWSCRGLANLPIPLSWVHVSTKDTMELQAVAEHHANPSATTGLSLRYTAVSSYGREWRAAMSASISVRLGLELSIIN